MRGYCWCCARSVTDVLPDETVIRAVLVCPECIAARRVTFADDDDDPVGRRAHRGATRARVRGTGHAPTPRGRGQG